MQLYYIFFYKSYLGTDYIADVIREKVAVVDASKYFVMLFLIAATLQNWCREGINPD